MIGFLFFFFSLSLVLFLSTGFEVVEVEAATATGASAESGRELRKARNTKKHYCIVTSNVEERSKIERKKRIEKKRNGRESIQYNTCEVKMHENNEEMKYMENYIYIESFLRVDFVFVFVVGNKM